MTTDAQLHELLKRYDKPVPRYTSFPTVPHWNPETLTLEAWKHQVIKTFTNEGGEMCLYIHLPFCEELCTYCACNKRITRNHKVEEPYLKSVLAEWDLYRNILPSAPIIHEIHLGGGTPTFFSPENLTALIEGILKGSVLAPHPELSVEVHPNYTQHSHLQALREIGFNRISLGVQDFDPQVQYIINRIQTVEQTWKVVDEARSLGYESVNFDLIYGLPRQNLDSIRHTFSHVAKMKPDRIAFYSYAHVPWKSKGQRRYTDDDVPRAKEKFDMFLTGRTLLEQNGYQHVGMDHFALPSDKLLIASQKGRLHRNFMGYTTTNHKLLIGLGASSISDTWGAMAQNEKTVEVWEQKVAEGLFPIVTGHLLSDWEKQIRIQILNLMCKLETKPLDASGSSEWINSLEVGMKGLLSDGLVEWNGDILRVTSLGKQFVRNVAAVFDPNLSDKKEALPQFSKAI